VSVLPGKLEWWHAVVAAAVVGAAWWALGGGGQGATIGGVLPIGSEDIQLRAATYMLPSDFFHYSPVSWAGRAHPYPASVGPAVAGLMNRQARDWADCDR